MGNGYDSYFYIPLSGVARGAGTDGTVYCVIGGAGESRISEKEQTNSVYVE